MYELSPVCSSTSKAEANRFVDSSDSNYLRSLIKAVEPDLAARAGLGRGAFAPQPSIRLVPLRRPGIHPVGIVEVESEAGGRRWFAKADSPQYTGGQSLKIESYFLTHVAPLIAAENPDLRSPRVVAYYADRELLVMEAVEGTSLKEHLFDFKGAERRDLPRLVGLTGEWLGRLHRLTADAAANPLEWLITEFEAAKISGGLAECGLQDLHADILSRLQRALECAPDFERATCTVHGEFTPLHVLVSGESIYVVDFGTSRLRFPYEDVSLFTTFYEGLMPWRLAAGTLRVGLRRQKRLFLDSYFAHAPFTFGEADHVIMSCLRIRSLVHLLSGWQKKNPRWGRTFLSNVASQWLRRSLAGACQDALFLLSETPESAFHIQAGVADDQGAFVVNG